MNNFNRCILPCNEQKKFDETKQESANNVNCIIIKSDINVIVSMCNTNNVTAHLHGTAITDSDLKLSVARVDNEIRVCAKLEKASSEKNNNFSILGNSVFINISNLVINGDLILDVQIPNKTFEKLSIESKNGNIAANSINSDTLSIDNKNGYIEVKLEAKCDITLNITNQNGNIDVSIENIKTSKVSVFSDFGNQKYNPKSSGMYTISGYIKSYTGDINFH